MKANVAQVKGITFVGKAASNIWVPMDGPEEFGGSNAATRPKDAQNGCGQVPRSPRDQPAHETAHEAATGVSHEHDQHRPSGRPVSRHVSPDCPKIIGVNPFRQRIHILG